MKRFVSAIVVFVLLCFATIVYAGAWSDAEVFGTYKAKRTAAQLADLNGSTKSAVVNYLLAAELAEKYATKEIQAWQLNNAGKALINAHKKLGKRQLIAEAVEYLEAAKVIADEINVAQLTKIVNSNLEYCNFWLQRSKK